MSKLKKADFYKKAEKLLAKKQYDTALKLLEPQVPVLATDGYFFFLLGWACYHKGDLQGGEIYLKRGISVDPHSIPLRQLLATTMLRKRDTTHAVKLWLEILDLDPDNLKATWALNQLKELTTSADLARFIISPAMARLVPPLKRGFNPYLLFLPLGLCILAIVTFFVIGFQGAVPELILLSNTPHRSKVEAVNQVFETQTYNPSKDTYLFTLTEKEANVVLKQADTYFYNHKDNLALRELNRIKNSNAKIEQKNKALKWAEALTVPTFTNLDTNFNYREVATTPLLYENCYVIWRGLISNLAITNEKITFKLFVGYENKQVLEGEVPVVLNFETHLEPNLPTEVLGQIKLDNNGQIYLVARSIYQLV